MTAKEKAKDLVKKHYSLLTGMEITFISKLILSQSGDSNYETAKQCAKLAIEEIINLDDFSAEGRTYWMEVSIALGRL